MDSASRNAIATIEYSYMIPQAKLEIIRIKHILSKSYSFFLLRKGV